MLYFAMIQNIERYEIIISGHVQGVGFRYFVYTKATELGLDGYTKNLPDGKVETIAEGPSERLNKLLEYLEQGHSYSYIDNVEVTKSEPKYDMKGFDIRM